MNIKPNESRVWQYDINLITLTANVPVFVVEIAPLENQRDAKGFIDYDWDNFFKFRGGLIAVPFKDNNHYEVRDYDVESLKKAWSNAREAIQSAKSKTIKCKNCECSFPRAILTGAMCPICYHVLGGTGNANRVYKWQEKMKDNAVKTTGTSWLIKNVKHNNFE